jgi:hypothetical protein
LPSDDDFAGGPTDLTGKTDTWLRSADDGHLCSVSYNSDATKAVGGHFLRQQV